MLILQLILAGGAVVATTLGGTGWRAVASVGALALLGVALGAPLLPALAAAAPLAVAGVLAAALVLAGLG